MNTLNLIRLNLNSPYEVWNESHDSYFFETDYGVKYKISFGDDAPIWKTGAYTFDIQNTNQKASPSDEKVKKTIINIVEELIYIPLVVSKLEGRIFYVIERVQR